MLICPRCYKIHRAGNDLDNIGDCTTQDCNTDTIHYDDIIGPILIAFWKKGYDILNGDSGVFGDSDLLLIFQGLDPEIFYHLPSGFKLRVNYFEDTVEKKLENPSGLARYIEILDVAKQLANYVNNLPEKKHVKFTCEFESNKYAEIFLQNRRNINNIYCSVVTIEKESFYVSYEDYNPGDIKAKINELDSLCDKFGIKSYKYDITF